MDRSLDNKILLEKNLLKALSKRSNYENYIDYVDKSKLVTETQLILNCYQLYFDFYDHKKIDFSDFITQFKTNWNSKSLTEYNVKWYTEALKSIAELDDIDAEQALIGLVNREFVDTINKIETEQFNAEKVRKALEIYEGKCAGIIRDFDADCFTSASADFSVIDKTQGIEYPFEPLRECLGSMVSGSLVVLNAAHNIGKTALSMTFAAHAFKQIQDSNRFGPILWFQTEGSLNTGFARFLSCLLKKKYKWILANQDRVIRYYTKNFQEKIFFFKGNNKGIPYLRAKIKKYKPSLMILDMAAAIMRPGNRNSSDTSNLETYFNSLRELTEECPIVATVQAGAGAKWWDKNTRTTRYKEWPSDDDIYNSKTAVQGAAETIITIGRDNDTENKRYLQTTKVKDTSKVKFTCELIEEYSRYELLHVYQNFVKKV